MKERFIRKLISILENSKLESLDLSTFWGMNKISLSKKKDNVSRTTIPQINEVSQDTKAISIEKSPSSNEQIKENNDNNTNDKAPEPNEGHKVTAPLVGTFYQSSKPGDPPFVKEGDTIKTGQIICIIEAMKIFNEIESEVDGIVTKVMVDDANPVEYGQILFHVKLND